MTLNDKEITSETSGHDSEQKIISEADKKKLQTAILLLLSLMFLTILYPQPIFPVLFAVIWIIYRVRCYLKGKQSFHADIFHILLFVMLFFSLVFGLGITAEIIKERQQSDVPTIVFSDGEGEFGFSADKPIIYLYPQEQTDVSVRLNLDGRLTCTYPAYQNGWNVTAYPDGTLTDESGMTYNYLYWEGETKKLFSFEEGFCIKGEDTAAFLETALAELGLNRREANEFIVYWLPKMQNNPYNIISFQGENYRETAKLTVNPELETEIRVFMAWYGTDSYYELPEQSLTAPERNGFTVVEWGGSEVGNNELK